MELQPPTAASAAAAAAAGSAPDGRGVVDGDAVVVDVAAAAASTSVNTTTTTGGGNAGTDETTIVVNVKTLTGQTFPVRISPHATVQLLKEQLSVTDGIDVAPDRQRLIWMGQELHDSSVPLDRLVPPVRDGAALHLVLRVGPVVVAAVPGGEQGAAPAPPQAQHVYGQVAMPFGQQQQLGGGGGMPPPLFGGLRPLWLGGGGMGGGGLDDDHHQHAALAASHRDLLRSSGQIRVFGVLLGLIGLIDLIIASSKRQYTQIALALLFLGVGAVAFYAGLYRTTRWALIYLVSLIGFVLTFSGLSVADTLSSADNQPYGLVGSAVLAALFPVVICAACVWCARAHWLHCRARDRLLVAPRHPLGQAPVPPHGVPFMAAVHAPAGGGDAFDGDAAGAGQPQPQRVSVLVVGRPLFPAQSQPQPPGPAPVAQALPHVSPQEASQLASASPHGMQRAPGATALASAAAAAAPLSPSAGAGLSIGARSGVVFAGGYVPASTATATATATVGGAVGASVGGSATHNGDDGMRGRPQFLS